MKKPKKRFERIPLVEVRKLFGEHAIAGERDAARGNEQLDPSKLARKNNATVTYLARATASAGEEKCRRRSETR